MPLQWVDRDARYGEKLATPDVSIADLIGEIDPIKVAEGRYLADEETIHYGLVPRTNRGIFAINELPDLTEKVQVGLFNLMEEKDVQIKGYKIRLPLDVVIVASANPEDYTSRGRIITPLKDRFDVQIRTHYPKSIDDELVIMEQEAAPVDQRSRKVEVPRFMKEILGHLTFEARKSNEINQSSGVSVRVTINKRVNRGAARKTLERLFMSDKTVAAPLGARAKNFKELPKRRGGQIWTKRPNKLHPGLEKGASATITDSSLRATSDCASTMSMGAIVPICTRFSLSPSTRFARSSDCCAAFRLAI